MSSRPRMSWATFAWVFLLLAGLAGCGGGDVINKAGGSPVTPPTPPASNTPTVTIVAPGASFTSESGYPVTFKANAIDPNPGATISSFTWDFGDQSPTVTVPVSLDPAGTTTHAFMGVTGQDTVFTVKVKATDSLGLTSAAAATVSINIPKDALVKGAITAPQAGLNVAPGEGYTFQAEFDPASLLPGVTATSYVWDFGDGTLPLPEVQIATTPNGAILHSFAQAGTYAVKVAVKDSLGNTGAQSTPVSVVVDPSYVNQKPAVTITEPGTATTSAYTSKGMNLAFTVQDGNNDTVTCTVDWGDGAKSEKSVSNTLAGVVVTFSHPYADTFTSSTRQATITVDASDNRGTSGQAVQQTRTVNVVYNTLPTAAITSPQASGTPPTGLPAGINPPYVVIPLNGKLTFSGASTLPGSQDGVTSTWTFPGGSPPSATGNNPGDIIFAGIQGAITPITVTYTVTDAFARTATATKLVLVDGINTQLFNLTLQYRRKFDNNANSRLDPVTLAAHGLGAEVQIFQDGLSNTYRIQDQDQLVGAKAMRDIPVRSDLPFYINIPAIGPDSLNYMMQIPNKPGIDPTLEATAVAGSSSFAFKNTSNPWNPTLCIVTAQGFADETDSAAERRMQGTTSVAGWTPGTKPWLGNYRWLDRLTIPFYTSDPLGALNQWTQNGNAVGAMSGIRANQLFAEWPMVLRSRALEVPAGVTSYEKPAASSPTDMGFVVDYPKYGQLDPPSVKSTVLFTDELQVFRVPKGTSDPYDLDAAGWASTLTSFTDEATPNLTPITQGPSQFQSWFTSAPGSVPLQGGINGLSIPYDKNTADRVPQAPSTRNHGLLRETFTYSEYLWSTVWSRPLVLNTSRLSWVDTMSIAAWPFFANSQPTTAWPSKSLVSPDNSSFTMNVTGGGTFKASAPVGLRVDTVDTPPSPDGVGRFYWTAYTPTYSASPGEVIARTWLADGAGTQQPAITFPAASTSGDATSALGFVVPQDVVVDKRARDAYGMTTGASTGGYRIMWFNPTKDANGAVVPPDFWVIEFEVNGGRKTHYLLPGSYPLAYPAFNPFNPPQVDPGDATQRARGLSIVTDARTYLPSGQATIQGDDAVAPGYCWFDVPPELRASIMDPSKTSYITVFALKAILKNNPVASKRTLNRPEWIDAIKTATASIKVLPASGVDLGYVYKIPFNYPWDIVVTNSARTAVAP